MKGSIKSYRTDSWYPKIYHSACLKNKPKKKSDKKTPNLYSLICLKSISEFFMEKSPFVRNKILDKRGWILRHGQVGLMLQ